MYKEAHPFFVLFSLANIADRPHYTFSPFQNISLLLSSCALYIFQKHLIPEMRLRSIYFSLAGHRDDRVILLLPLKYTVYQPFSKRTRTLSKTIAAE